jgi:hypothetical protein
VACPKSFSGRDRADLIENWMDGFVQKDILKLYPVARPDSLRRLLETLLAQSGEPFEASPLEKKVPGIKRDTSQAYAQMLEDTQAIHLLRPFHGDAASEIESQPVAWGFDTGFVRHYKAWDRLRETDYEFLWRHAVLTELQSHHLRYELRYFETQERQLLHRLRAPEGRQTRIHGDAMLECERFRVGFATRVSSRLPRRGKSGGDARRTGLFARSSRRREVFRQIRPHREAGRASGRRETLKGGGS